MARVTSAARTSSGRGSSRRVQRTGRTLAIGGRKAGSRGKSSGGSGG